MFTAGVHHSQDMELTGISTKGWIYFLNVIYYLTIKLWNLHVCCNVESITLSEISHTQKDKYHMFLLTLKAEK